MDEHAQDTRWAIGATFRALRPKQWTKNVLVFAAPLAAGRLLEPRVLTGALVAFVTFVAASAAIYLVNDIRDAEEDRLHPAKRHRPIAAGELSPATAWVLAALLAVLALAGGFAWRGELGFTLALYLAAQIAYTLLLKHQPILDLALVSTGFLLRAIAGGVAAGIPLSQWFLLVASFGSLFMVAGKRYSELRELGSEAGTRRSLARYTPEYLRFVWMLAAGLVVAFYSLWAFSLMRPGPLGLPWSTLSVAPFTLAMLRYALAVDAARAGEPEDVVLGDRALLALGVLWLATMSLTLI